MAAVTSRGRSSKPPAPSLTQVSRLDADIELWPSLPTVHRLDVRGESIGIASYSLNRLALFAQLRAHRVASARPPTDPGNHRGSPAAVIRTRSLKAVRLASLAY